MHRVVTRYKDQYGKLVTEYGPWQPHREEAEYWAALLAQQGYHTAIESMPSGHDQDELADALANMA